MSADSNNGRKRILVFRQSDVVEYGAESVPGQVTRRQGPISACDVGPTPSEATPGHIARRHFGENLQTGRKAAETGENRQETGDNRQKPAETGKLLG